MASANTFNGGKYAPARDAGKLITRKQLAEAAGIEFRKLRDLINFNKDIQWPNNYGSKRLFKYAVDEVAAFLKANDLHGLAVNYPCKAKVGATHTRQLLPTGSSDALDLALAQRFIRGDYAAIEVQQEVLERRKKAIDHQPQTTRLHVKGIWPVPDYFRDR